MTSTTTGPIGAVIAMQVELDHLLDQGIVESETSDGPWQVSTATIGAKRLVAIRSGIGMVSAAAATEYLIGRFQPSAIVNSGCTGAHTATLLQGDVVIGCEVVYHASKQVLPTGEERHMGFNFKSVGGPVQSASLHADDAMLAVAQRVARDTPLPAWPETLDWPRHASRRAPQVLTGPVASADIWTQAIDQIDLLHQRHGTLCEDMEAAAIAQIASLHGLPFLTIKDITNNERFAQTNLVGDLAGFPMEEAGRRAAILLAATIANLP